MFVSLTMVAVVIWEYYIVLKYILVQLRSELACAISSHVFFPFINRNNNNWGYVAQSLCIFKMMI